MSAGPSNRANPAPYFVALREAERRILRDAIAVFGNPKDAAVALGISYDVIRKRIEHLGGVLPDQPKREPTLPLFGGTPVSDQADMERMKAERKERARKMWITRRAKKAKKNEHNGNGFHTVQRISGDSGSEDDSGERSSAASKATLDGENRCE